MTLKRNLVKRWVLASEKSHMKKRGIKGHLRHFGSKNWWKPTMGRFWSKSDAKFDTQNEYPSLIIVFPHPPPSRTSLEKKNSLLSTQTVLETPVKKEGLYEIKKRWQAWHCSQVISKRWLYSPPIKSALPKLTMGFKGDSALTGGRYWGAILF